MIDHLSIGVKDLQRSTKFYDAVLEPLGFKRYMTFPDDSCGYGLPEDRFFWIVKPEIKVALPARQCILLLKQIVG
jgi:catechol 2,3-dioxygenase-like lactoylglutathione lyase family enzyme